MKKLFYDIGEFMYRRPTECSSEVDFSANEVELACKDPIFREKISIASPALVEMMDIYMKTPEQLSDKKLIGLNISIMKYLARSKERTTPFGLFSGVGIGCFSENEKFPYLKVKNEKKINVDSEWLFGLIEHMEKCYMERLEFKFNDACHIKGNRVALIYSTEKEAEEISIRFTKVFKVLFDTIKDFTKYEVILKRLQLQYPGTSIEKIKAYVGELIEKGFLISNLRPSFNSTEPLTYFIQQCQTMEITEISEKVIEIERLCEEYMKTDFGTGTVKYNEIKRKMQEIYKSSAYLQVDTIINGEDFQLEKNISESICELASLFVYLSNDIKNQYGYLQPYRNRFIEKYGIDREVPILEMLDSNIGIGAPTPYIKPQNDFYEEYNIKDNYRENLKSYFLTEYEKALQNSTYIDIKIEEIQRLIDCTVQPEEIPISLELYFILKKEGGVIRLNLSPNCGSFVAGKTFGRFSVLSDKMASVVKKCNMEERRIRTPHSEMCEISFLPSPTRNGNIVRTLSFREKETSVFTNGTKECEDIINLNDIYIGVFDEKFYARDRRSGKQIIFESNNMYNPMLNPNVFRFLQDISYEGKRAWSEFPWSYIYADFRHIPTIKFKGIVLQSEKWKINLQELKLKKNNFENFKEKFLEWMTESKMPLEIYLVDTDNRIRLNLSKELSVRIVYDELKKHKDRDLIFEKVEDGTDIVYDDGRPYATEIVVPIFRKNVENKPILQPVKETFMQTQRLVLPFNNWLYLKLYCNESREEELIAFYIMEFCEMLKKNYGIDYFYMRYADPKPHIRLRLHASQELLIQVYPQILEWSAELFSDQVVGDMNISVYDKEIERYGGVELMGIAERLFFADSYIVESILRLKRLGKITVKLEEVAVISIIMYIEKFYEGFDEQLQFLTINYHSSEFMSEFKKEKENLLKICDIENNWRNLKNKEEGKIIYELLIKRDEVIDEYRKRISIVNSDPIFKNGIVASVVHLHCNRLLGTNRELERKLMAFAESVMYAKKYIMKRLEDNGEK